MLIEHYTKLVYHGDFLALRFILRFCFADQTGKAKVVQQKRTQQLWGTWHGASMRSSLSSFANAAIHVDEYNECGPEILQSHYY